LVARSRRTTASGEPEPPEAGKKVMRKRKSKEVERENGNKGGKGQGRKDPAAIMKRLRKC